jgi:hypothetical protein
MQLALRGLGATFVDTGGNITPANFFPICCAGNWFGTTFASQACKDFGDANAAMFGPPGTSYCSKEAQDFATLNKAAASIPLIVPQPPIPGYQGQPNNPSGSAIVPPFACPYSPCPCDGRQVVTAQDATDLLTCQALQQQALQNAAIAAGMKQASGELCTTQADTCTAGIFGSFMSPSADCTTCVLDFTKGSTLLVIAAVGFFLFMAVKLR